jgi:lipase ATG15
VLTFRWHPHQALESKCHTGKTILYDTVTVKGWSVDIRTHSIVQIINKVLADPWPVADEPGDEPDKPNEPKEPKEPKKPKDGSVQASWWGWGRKGPKKGKTGEDDGGDGDGDEEDDGGWEKHGGVPRAKAEDECVDCYRWWVICCWMGLVSADEAQGVWRWLGQGDGVMA